VSYGWLAPRPGIPRTDEWFGLPLQKTLETRWEEFTFVRDTLRGVKHESVEDWGAIDAGCGFEPGVHIMPEIMARAGWHVTAVDLKSGCMPMKDHPLIDRVKGDMLDTPYADSSFDAYVSVSVLEHLSIKDREQAMTEATRLVKPGGLLVVTMDGCWPRMDLPFDFGEPVIPMDPLLNNIGQPISFMVGRKCT